MVLTDDQLDRTEARVLAEMANAHESYSPLQLIERLRTQDIPEALIRAAIWYLIDRNAVLLTKDRQLQRRDPLPAERLAGSAGA